MSWSIKISSIVRKHYTESETWRCYETAKNLRLGDLKRGQWPNSAFIPLIHARASYVAELQAQTLPFIFSSYRDIPLEYLNYQIYAKTITFMTGENGLSNTHSSAGTLTLFFNINVTKKWVHRHKFIKNIISI